MPAARTIPGDWHPGTIPENVVLGEDSYLETSYVFLLCRSRVPGGVTLGKAASVYKSTMFDLGPGARVSLGDFALCHGARIVADSGIAIGSYCMISWNVVIMDTLRVPRDAGERRRELEALAGRDRRRPDAGGEARPVRIGTNVWIGFDACILPGVTIGEGAIVGAHAVVAADVEPYTIVAGNPARRIRRLDPGEGSHAGR